MPRRIIVNSASIECYTHTVGDTQAIPLLATPTLTAMSVGKYALFFALHSTKCSIYLLSSWQARSHKLGSFSIWKGHTMEKSYKRAKTVA